MKQCWLLKSNIFCVSRYSPGFARCKTGNRYLRVPSTKGKEVSVPSVQRFRLFKVSRLKQTPKTKDWVGKDLLSQEGLRDDISHLEVVLGGAETRDTDWWLGFSVGRRRAPDAPESRGNEGNIRKRSVRTESPQKNERTFKCVLKISYKSFIKFVVKSQNMTVLKF